MTTPTGDIIKFIFRDNLWHLPLWTQVRELKPQAAAHSNTAVIPMLATNQYALLLDLLDIKEPQSLISSCLSTAGSKRKGREFRKVTFQRYCSSDAELRAMAAVHHDASSVLQACPSLIMPDNLTVDERMM
eukprot:1982740-Rhodomonas_salina.1